MIKIRGDFIQASDGSWHNMRMVKSFYIGGSDDVGYRICYSYEYNTKKPTDFMFCTLGDTRKNKEEAQEQLDGIFDLIEYERC